MTTLSHAASEIQIWPDWTEEYRWTIGPDDAPAPGPEAAGHDLSDEAYHSALTLTLEGETPAYPSFPTRAERVAFLMGVRAGLKARAEEERAYDAWIDARAIDRLEDAFTMPEYQGPRETDGFAPGYYS